MTVAEWTGTVGTRFLQIRDTSGDIPLVSFNDATYTPSTQAGYTFCWQPGTYTSVQLGAELWQDTFQVLARGSQDALRAPIIRLRALARTQYGTSNSAVNPIWLREGTSGELPRQALIYSLTIVPLDGQVARRDQRYNAQVFTIIVERGVWEQTAPIWHDYQNLSISDTNASYAIPGKFQQGDTAGRINHCVIDSQYTGRIKYLWMGIKPNLVGGLGLFNPRVKIEKKSASQGSDLYTEDTSFVPTGTDTATYLGGTAAYCDFTSTASWATRVGTELRYWNSSANGLAANQYKQYLGDYRLVTRIKSTDAESRFGLRAGWTFGNDSAKNYGKPVYPTSVPTEWKWIDLGDITIGGEGWSNDIARYQQLERFTIFWQATRLSGSGGLYFDDAFIIPKDHFVALEVPREVGTDDMVSIYTNPAGQVSAYVRDRADWRSSVLATRGTNQQALDTASEIKQTVPLTDINNWRIPETGGRVVLLIDNRDGSTKSLTAKHLLSLTITPRTELFNE